jgi:HEAT repeat protein
MGARAVPPLIAILKGAGGPRSAYNAEAILQAAEETLVGIGASAVSELGTSIGNTRQSPFVTRSARVLRRIGTPRAVDILIGGLGTSHEDRRATFAEQLARIGSPAIDQLVAALERHVDWDTQKVAREEVVRIICEIGDRRAVDLLLAVLANEESRDAHRPAAEALRGLGWQPREAEADKAVAYWRLMNDPSECAKIGEPAVPILADLFVDGPREARGFAAKVLERIGSDNATDALEDARVALRARHAAVAKEKREQLASKEAARREAATRRVTAVAGRRKREASLSPLEKAIRARDALRSEVESLNWRAFSYDGSGLTVINKEMAEIEKKIQRLDEQIEAMGGS